jgi:hypothetical protein
MRTAIRLVVCSALVSVAPSMGAAQVAVDPSGHWEGLIQAPDRTVTIGVDLSATANGKLSGTYAEPDAGLKALPLAAVVIDGRTVRLVLKAGSGGGTV